MSHCANYILVFDGEVHTSSDRWGAKSILERIFYGPDETFDLFTEMEEGPLYSELMCEGAVLADYDRQFLRVFGGEDIQSLRPLQRTYIRLLRACWSEWDVDWAYRGMAGIADDVAISVVLNGPPGAGEFGKCLDNLPPWSPLDKVRLRDKGGTYRQVVYANPQEQWLRPADRENPWPYRAERFCLVTLSTPDGDWVDRHVGIGPRSFMELFQMGPQLCEMVPAAMAAPLAPASQGARGGLVIDLGRHRLYYWSGRTLPSWLDKALAESWPGWRHLHLGGGVPEQLSVTGRDPAQVHIPVEILLEMTLAELGADTGLETFLDDLSRRYGGRPDVELAPGLLNMPQAPRTSQEVKEKYLQMAIASVLATGMRG